MTRSPTDFILVLELDSLAGSSREVAELFDRSSRVESLGFDALWLREVVSPEPSPRAIDSLLLAGAIAPRTSRIGLIPELLPSLSQPYTAARRILSLDHMNAGRSGWSVQAVLPEALLARRGGPVLSARDQRERAAEHAAVVLALWDSWDADARVLDKASGVNILPERVHPTDHVGRHFRVAGPLDIPRSVQGRPVLIGRAADLEAAGQMDRADLLVLDDLSSAAPRRGNQAPRRLLTLSEPAGMGIAELFDEGLIDGVVLRPAPGEAGAVLEAFAAARPRDWPALTTKPAGSLRARLALPWPTEGRACGKPPHAEGNAA